MYKELLTSQRGDTFVISLNRPEKLNAFTKTMQDELIKVFDHTDQNDDIKSVVITGEGRAYCAGADLVDGPNTFNYAKEGNRLSNDDNVDGGGLVALRIFKSKKPVIGAINGDAVGVGVTMTLPMDIRIASDSARFGFVFSRRGAVPEACSSWFLPRIVGISKALDWCYTGKVFNSQEALQYGLVSDVLTSDKLLDRAIEIGSSYSNRTSAISVSLARQMMWGMLAATHPEEAHFLDSMAMEKMGKSPDIKEGIASFLEKRAPNFPMKVSKDLPDLTTALKSK
ncbi:enoyl-CoA hydratase-related protein [Paracoccaceae bacterium]|nr:enoyl-CoA hydratase-related protein [Paracoccaceae bacterium]